MHTADVYLQVQGVRWMSGREIRIGEGIGTPLCFNVCVAASQRMQIQCALLAFCMRCRVLDVVSARSTRVVLLTDRHIAYLKARRVQQVGANVSECWGGAARCVGKSVQPGLKMVLARTKTNPYAGP